MKMIMLFLNVFLFSILTNAVVVVEYDIANANGTQDLPLQPSVSLINAGNLFFGGSRDGFPDTGQVAAYDWQIAPDVASVSPNGQNYSFTVTPSNIQYDFSNARLTFGASTQFDGNMAIFANNNLIGNFDLGNNGNFDNYSLTLGDIGIISSPIEFKLVGWGITEVGYLGLDTGVIPATFENLKLENVVSGSPIPEPQEYVIIAGLSLLCFVAYKKIIN